MRFRISGASRQGARDYNDDHFCIGTSTRQLLPLSLEVEDDDPGFRDNGLLAAVADGMGSYQGGALASKTALESLTQTFHSLRNSKTEARLKAALKESLRSLKQVLKTKNMRQAGTTMAGVVFSAPDRLTVFHIGDSRVLRLRDGALAGLTLDHTPVGEDLAFGRISLEQAIERPDAFQLTRSLGLVGDTRVETRIVDYLPGDSFLLLTDGVCSPGRGLTGPEIEQFLKSETSEPLLCSEMLDRAVEQDGDNATLVLVRVEA